MSYAIHEWAICDNCEKQIKLDKSIGWREIKYISRTILAMDDPRSTAFCSWGCIAGFATEQARSDQMMFSEGVSLSVEETAAQQIVYIYRNDPDVEVTRTGATVTFTEK